VIGWREWFERKIPLETYPEALVARYFWEYFRNKGFSPGDAMGLAASRALLVLR
jgi:hypothetical protein